MSVTKTPRFMVIAHVTVLARGMLLAFVISPLHGSYGLSTRRARGTKSRGPKDFLLEVGARRALRLRLLVLYIIAFLIVLLSLVTLVSLLSLLSSLAAPQLFIYLIHGNTMMV